PRLVEAAQQRVGFIERRVGKIHAGDEAAHQARAEDGHGNMRRARAVHRAGLDRAKPVAAVAIGAGAAPEGEVAVDRRVAAVGGMIEAAAGIGLPDLDQRIDCRLAALADDPPRKQHDLARGRRRARRTRREIVRARRNEMRRKERADRLRRRRRRDQPPLHASIQGVPARPRSTMSKAKPSAGTGASGLSTTRQTRRSRAAASGTLLMSRSWALSGSPGKYICVTSRLIALEPKSEKWICGGRHQFPELGTG